MRSILSSRPVAAAFFAILSIFALPVMAQAGGSSDTTIRVKVDEARVIKLDRPAAKVILGNPAIADVAAQSTTLLVLTGKSFGATNVIVLDENDDEIVHRKLSVQLTAKTAMTLHRGSDRFSYTCAPFCQSQLVMGDQVDYYKNNAEQIEKKFGVVTEVMSGHSK